MPYELRPSLINDLYHVLNYAKEFPRLGIQNCIAVLEKQNFDQEKFENFIKYTKILDKNRNESLANVIPEFSKYFQ
jgi:hypothetical protein